MANYKETTVSGAKYNRANIVRFNNYHGTTPSVDINEEEIITLADSTVVKRDIGLLHAEYDAAKTFRKTDLTTGELGEETCTHQELFLLLHGLYLTLGDERDNPTVPVLPDVSLPV